ncbi:hypothetical protein EP30_01045 [Bifidobacterium sp. UTCIF-39]|uniref:hypothetical protein n=1 Tax=Bifidobacterium sp. UTCIF-39 TaxID=1465359 RepID=UPI00112AF288|nr:hypothetical protein [Bifidobacterium sp. UTCIF-39]TPF97558.1 hypothetical protein EP30_01045 [Bifidobacterium sp. UTCIF-39]
MATRSSDAIPANAGTIITQLANRIAQLEQRNALLQAQIETLINTIPDDTWATITGTTPDNNEE